MNIGYSGTLFALSSALFAIPQFVHLLIMTIMPTWMYDDSVYYTISPGYNMFLNMANALAWIGMVFFVIAAVVWIIGQRQHRSY